jgi:hypothetical protein
MQFKELFRLTGIPVLVASLCCVSPLVLLLFGFGGVAFASSLADTLYGDYKWVFRIAGLLALALSVVVYWRRKGVCTLAQAKRKRQQILNSILLALFVAIIGYLFFLYVVVHYAGVWAGVWE